MRFAGGIERRDPASSVLRLGTMLVRAGREALSGAIQVRDRELEYNIVVSGGSVSGLRLGGKLFGQSKHDIPFIEKTALKLFSLSRPHVLWQPSQNRIENRFGISSGYIVLNGVTSRRDLFAPLQLVKRMPVETLSVGAAKMNLIRQLPLDSAEIQFLERLRVPTPIPMILWKRGLEPSHAGALLVALNLLGVFQTCTPGNTIITTEYQVGNVIVVHLKDGKISRARIHQFIIPGQSVIPGVVLLLITVCDMGMSLGVQLHAAI